MSKTTNVRSGSVYQSPTQNGDRSFIPDGSVSSNKIQDLAVTKAKLADSANIFEMIKNGFQNFVDQSVLMTATTATGTPAAGTFHSTVVGRASISDLSQNLKVQMGPERNVIPNLYQLQNEFGPNGEPVFGVVNDTLGQVRFVGNWSMIFGSAGQYTYNGNLSGFYVEITLYGT